MAASDLKPKSPTAPPYLTIIPDRRPEEKVHRTLGLAKSAVSYKAPHYDDMAIFEQRDGEWQLLYAIDKGARYEDLPWVKEAA